MGWETVPECFFLSSLFFLLLCLFLQSIRLLLYSFLLHLLCFHCKWDVLYIFDTCVLFSLLCQKLVLPCSVGYVSLVTGKRWLMVYIYMLSSLCYHPLLGLSRPLFVIFFTEHFTVLRYKVTSVNPASKHLWKGHTDQFNLKCSPTCKNKNETTKQSNWNYITICSGNFPELWVDLWIFHYYFPKIFFLGIFFLHFVIKSEWPINIQRA